MAILPYFIAPLTPEQYSKTLVAHTARGFCFHINTPASDPAPRPFTAFRTTLGLNRVWKNLVIHDAQRTPVIETLRTEILACIRAYWERPLHELDLPWIDLLFQQLNEKEQYAAWDAIVAINYLPSNLPLTWRPTHMKALPDTQNIPHDILSKLEMNLASLEKSLLEKDAMMPQHLRNVHSLLISYPETVHLLEDAEIARIIEGAQVHTKTEIVKAAAKGGAASGSRKKIALEDL